MMGQEKNMFFHNAWRNVIGGFLIMALLHSMLQTCFSLFLFPVTGDMHISTTAFSGCSSIVAIASMFAAPKIGKLMEHSEGLRIHHYIQRKDTTDHPRVLEAPGEDWYDIVFA